MKSNRFKDGMQNMRRKRFTLVFILFFLIITFSMTQAFGLEDNEKTPYYELFQFEYSFLSNNYADEIMLYFNKYTQAEENGSTFPLFSYNLLLDCYRNIIGYNQTEQIDLLGNKSAVDAFMSVVEKNLSDMPFYAEDITPNTFASFEWLDLAKREIQLAATTFNQSKMHYNESDYFSSMLYLITTNAALHKAYGFATLAKMRNMDNDTLKVNTSDFYSNLEILSENWINHVQSSINFYESIGYKDQLIYAKDILNQSKQYNSNKLFYTSIMNAAYALAMIEYYIYQPGLLVNYSQTLQFCKTQLDYADTVMDTIHRDPNLDGIFAESTLELARIHLQDAEKEKNEINATSLALVSLQESIIVRQQALAVIDMKNAVIEGVSEVTVTGPNNLDTETDDQTLIYAMFGIIILETIGLLILVSTIKRKK